MSRLQDQAQNVGKRRFQDDDKKDDQDEDRRMRKAKNQWYGTMTHVQRLRTLSALSGFLFDPEPETVPVVNYSRLSALSVISIKLGHSGCVNVGNMLDVLLPYSAKIYGFQVFESHDSRFFYVFRLLRKCSVASSTKLFEFAVKFSLNVTSEDEQFIFTQGQPLPDDFMKRVNKILTVESHPDSPEVWLSLQHGFQELGFFTNFKWHRSVQMCLNDKEEEVLGQTMEYESCQVKNASDQESLLTQLCVSVKRFFLNDLFKPQIQAKGDLFFGQNGSWLTRQKFVACGGGLANTIEAQRLFRQFYTTFDAERLAQMVYDAYTVECFTLATSRLEVNLQPFLNNGLQTPQMLAQSCREETCKSWVVMIEQSLELFCRTLRPDQLSVMAENNSLMAHLIKFARTVSGRPEINLTEIDFETLGNYAVMGYYILNWTNHNYDLQNMSVVIDGTSGGGKSVLINILTKFFDFQFIEMTPGRDAFQNSDVASSAGYVALEIELNQDVRLPPMIRNWGNWIDQKSVRVKFGNTLISKIFSPLVFSTNYSFDGWLNELKRRPKDEHSDAIARRYAVMTCKLRNTSHVYTNHSEVMQDLHGAITRIALTLAVVCFGKTLLENVRVYEYTDLFPPGVSQQPLFQMFEDLVEQGRKSKDIFMRTLCQQDSELSEVCTQFVRQAVITCRSSFNERNDMNAQLNLRKIDLARLLQAEIGKEYEAVQVPGVEQLVNVQFSETGFAAEQTLYAEALQSFTRRDVASLLKAIRKEKGAEIDIVRFLQHLRTRTTEVQEGMTNWFAYLIRFTELEKQGVSVVSRAFVDRFKKGLDKHCNNAEESKEEPKEFLIDSFRPQMQAVGEQRRRANSSELKELVYHEYSNSVKRFKKGSQDISIQGTFDDCLHMQKIPLPIEENEEVYEDPAYQGYELLEKTQEHCQDGEIDSLRVWSLNQRQQLRETAWEQSCQRLGTDKLSLQGDSFSIQRVPEFDEGVALDCPQVYQTNVIQNDDSQVESELSCQEKLAMPSKRVKGTFCGDLFPTNLQRGQH